MTASAVAQPRAQTAPAPDSETPPPQSVSRGENFSAKPAPQLFASDCTGAGCHKGPGGLAKGQSTSSLASFLRQHYTNSQQSAAALAAYLAGVPGDARPTRQKPEPRTRHAVEPNATPKHEPRKPATAARTSRHRQATAEPVPLPPPEPPALAAPPPAPPPPKKFDIFD